MQGMNDEDRRVIDIYNSLSLACELDNLKWRVRTGWNVWMIRGRRESISEHCHGALILANLLYPYHPDRDKIDINRVNLMLIWHEMGEKKIGDVPEIDRKRHKNKAEAEHAAWREMLAELPKEQRDFIYDLLMEFDAHETPEAKFAYYIDKIEANKQMKHYVDAGRTWPLKWIVRFRKVIRRDEETQKIIADGAKTPAEVFMADAYQRYKDDPFFMEVHKLLKAMDTARRD